MSNENDNIVTNVDEFVTAAVLEGVSNAPATFMNQLEEALRMDVAIAKSGSVDNYLQEMIEIAAEELVSEDEY
jgi:hypothetical protein